MKKTLSMLLCLTLACMFAITAVADDPRSFNVPKAVAAPTVDGVINADEWANALVVDMPKGATFLHEGDVAYTGDTYEGATFKFMWTEEGIWFAASVTDKTESNALVAANAGSYNNGDGLQFNIYTARDIVGALNGEMLFFSYTPKADDGKPYVGEHFCYGDGATGQNVAAAKIASKMGADGTSYDIEGLIPAESFGKVAKAISIASGAKFYMNNIVMENDGTGTHIISDNKWFDGATANEYVLTDAVAGPVPQTEAPTTAEAPAADVPAAPVANPTSGDATILLVIAMILAPVAVVAVKKATKR